MREREDAGLLFYYFYFWGGGGGGGFAGWGGVAIVVAPSLHEDMITTPLKC